MAGKQVIPPSQLPTKRKVTVADIQSVLDDDEYTSLPDTRHRVFVDEYVLTKNATQAYLKAFKCSYNTAKTEGCKLLAKPCISHIIECKIAERAANAHVDAEYVLINLKSVVDRCMQTEPVMTFDKAEKAYVQARDDEGNPMYQFDSKGANQALELIGKHIGMFIDRKEININNSFDVTKLSTEEIRIELEKQQKIAELALNTIDIESE
jgi:phage terminase small subunit